MLWSPALAVVWRQDGDIAQCRTLISRPMTAEGEPGADDLAMEFGDPQKRAVVTEPAGQIQEAPVLAKGGGSAGADELEGAGRRRPAARRRG